MPQKRTIPRVCRTCGTAFLAYLQLVKQGKALYCGRACSANRHAGRVVVSGDVALVSLMARDGTLKGYAVIDADDAEWVSQWGWTLSEGGYAVRGEKDHKVYLHRALLGLREGDGLEGDHIDRNRMNCRRSNLRPLSEGTNQQNISSHTGSSSGFRGVTWNKQRGKWQAQVQTGGKTFYLGLFDTEVEAAEVVSSERLRLMPHAVD